MPTGSGNFNSFNDAVTAMSCGITGPVVFNVDSASGPYNEQVNIPATVNGTSTNTITFNGNGAILTQNLTAGGNYATLNLDGADYVTVNNLRIEALGTVGFGVHLMNAADNNTFNNCFITANPSSTSSAVNCVSMSGSMTSYSTSGVNGMNNTFSGCTLTGGYFGFTFYGSAVAGNTNNNVINCTIQDYYAYGVYCLQQGSGSISGNIIGRPTRTSVTTHYGVYLATGCTNMLIERNKITKPLGGFSSSPSTAAAYGIYCSGSNATAGNENKLYNNLIADFRFGSTGTQYGIYLSSSDYTKVYHNTISLDNTASTAGTTYGIYNNSGSGIDIRNNIVSISREGTGTKYCLYFALPAQICDNNDLYMSSSAGTKGIGYYTTAYTTFAAWQGANNSAWDGASVSAAPKFVDSLNGNFEPTNPFIDNLGTPIGITVDVNNLARSTTNPDMGAYEFASASCITPIMPGTLSFFPVSSTYCQNAPVTIKLTGHSAGSGQTYQLESSIGPGGPFSTVGSPQSSYIFQINATSTLYYRIALTCGASTVYSNEVLMNVTPAFPAGTYTINKTLPTAGTNFNSFTAAVAALNCGVTGPVVFDVVSGTGPYDEQVNIPILLNTSSTNTVTFNGNGNVLTKTLTTTGTNYATLNLDGADYLVFNNLTVQAMGATYGFAVHLMNNADNNSFNNCTFNAAPNSTATTSGCVNMSGSMIAYSTSGSNGSNNTFTGCTTNGGYFGFFFYGISAGSNANNKIISCSVKDFYYYGIYGYNQGSPVYSQNTIERPTRTTVTTFYGVYMGGACTNILIEKNKIRNPFGAIVTPATTAAYGIGLNSNGILGNEHVIVNNLISDFNNNNGTQYGIYVGYYDYVKVQHNTVTLDFAGTTTGTSYGIFHPGSNPLGVDVRNNIVKITRGGTGIKYGIYLMMWQPANTICNYNDVYLTGTGTNYWGFDDYNYVGFTTLAAWQAASGNLWDLASQSFDPLFNNPSTGDYSPTNAQLDNIGTPLGVTTDINNNSRSANWPDMGAYEFAGPACTLPVVAGTLATSSGITVYCSGNQVSMNLTGNSVGSGQTYQLQSGPTIAGPWTNVGSAQPASIFTFNASVTQYYQVAVTCGASTVNSNAVLITVPSALSGTYTINKTIPASSTNFVSFADAITAINCGIAGPVVLNVVSGSGPYNEQVSINQTANTSSTNTITINGNGETLTFSSASSSAPSTFELNGVDYVTVNNLTIEGTGASYAFACHLWNQADNNTFNNCTFTVPANTTTSLHVPFSVSGSATSATTTGLTGNNNVVSGCTMNNGYYSAMFYGSTSTPNTGNQVVNCTMNDFYYTSAYSYYQNGIIISNNTVQRPNRIGTFTTTYGLFVTTGTTNALVERNKIMNLFGGNPTQASTVYYVYVAAAASVGNENKLYNNLIYNTNGNSTLAGMYLTGATYLKVYHNTISVDFAGATAGTTYGIYSSGTAGVDIKNNNITVSRGGTGTKYGLYYTTIATASNYNNVYLNAPAGSNNYGYGPSTAYATLALWKAANSNIWDQNSWDLDPQPVTPAIGNFSPSNQALDDKGTPVGVLTDINSAARSTTMPDIGAYEFAIMSCFGFPTAGTAVGPTGTYCAGAPFVLALTGYTVATGITIDWESSPAGLNLFTAIPGATSSSYSVPTGISTSTDYRAKVTCTNGGLSDYSNVIAITVPAGMSGAYTINSAQATGGTNFQTFNDAVSMLNCSGVSGPVVFNVASASGPYNEQVTITSVNGASSTNTITFNGNGNTLTFAAASTATPSTLELNGADFIAVNNLTIEATGATAAFACHLWNQADSNTFNGCTFTVPANTTTSVHVPFSVSGSKTSATTTGLAGDGNIASGCTMNNGYYSAIFYGNTAAANMGNQVIGCTMNDFYYASAYSYYQNGIVISNNIVQRPNRTGTFTTTYGIFITTATTNAVVERNKISNLFGGNPTQASTAYYLYCAAAASVGNENKIINNLIYDMNGNSTLAGMYLTGATFVQVYHNTISVDYAGATAGTTYGIYATGASGVDIKNNNIVITRGGTGTKYGLYLSNTNIQSNYNNVYLNAPAGTNNYAYGPATAYATLAAWQAANGMIWDQNSRNDDPLFANPAAGNFAPTSFVLDDKGTPVGVLNDINNAVRSTTTPDMGAYEYSIPSCAGNPTAGTATGPTGACSGVAFNLTLTGYTLAQGISIQWESSPTGLNNWSAISGATNPTSSVSQTVATDYRAKVTCSNGGGFDYSNVIVMPMHPFYNCYCVPTYTNADNTDRILNVTLGTLVNNTSSQTLPPTYFDYTTLQPGTLAIPTIMASTVDTVSITFDSDGNQFNGVWIDYDQNGVFDPAEFSSTNTNAGSGGTAKVAISIPASALTGITRMRIRGGDDTQPTAGQACGASNSTYGEAEDYLVNIIPAPACSGTPTAGTASASISTICQSSPFNLQLATSQTTSGIVYQWESSPAGQNNWTAISGATSLTHTVSNATANTDYRAAVTCTSVGGGTGYSNTVTVTVNNPSVLQTFPGARCDAGPVTLAAEGSAGTTVKWYNAITGGTSLGTGNAFTTPTIATNTTYYAAAVSGGGGSATAPLPPHSSVYSGIYARGYWFVAPVNFTITGLMVAPEAGTGLQYIHIFKTFDPYPIATTGSTNFTTLAYISGGANNTVQNVNISVNAGDTIGILGTVTGIANSYDATGLSTTTIAGQTVALNRLGYQGSVETGPAPNYWGEAMGSTGQIGRVFITYTTGCEGTRVPVTASITGVTSGTGLVAGGTTIGANHIDGATISYESGCLDKVAAVVDAPGGNVLGVTSAIAVVSPTVQTFNTFPYVPRVFDITPTSNGPATVTLYALQSEFNAYNSYVTSNSLGLPLLPTSPTDPNVTNIVVTQYHGNALAGTTGPLGLYNASNKTFIQNSSITAVWTGNYWSMTFPVAGFSGFFIHSGTGPLEIELMRISAVNVGERNRIDWKTVSEQSGDMFELERSVDGTRFTHLSTITAKGAASTYSYWDERPIQGLNHYRIKMVDKTGKFTYSDVVTATVKAKTGLVVEAYPNPVSDVLTVQTYGKTGNNATVSIADVTGKVIMMVSVKDNKAEINMAALAQGVYLVKYADSKESQTIKVNKQ